MDKWLYAPTPVNKQAAVISSWSKTYEYKEKLEWSDHVERGGGIPTRDDLQRLSRLMLAWAKRQKWDRCDKMRVVNRLAEQFGVRFSLCRLIMNEWELRGRIKCRRNGVEFTRQCKRG